MRPVSQAFLQISDGNVPCSSSSPATGMISLRVNSRAVSVSCFSSSDRSKLGMCPRISLFRGVRCGRLAAGPAFLALGGLLLLQHDGIAGGLGPQHEAQHDAQDEDDGDVDEVRRGRQPDGQRQHQRLDAGRPGPEARSSLPRSSSVSLRTRPRPRASTITYASTAIQMKAYAAATNGPAGISWRGAPSTFTNSCARTTAGSRRVAQATN